ncbi:MAG: lysine exporter LysO family protein, partial [Betaproteobacteria bacterium]|nr:lysine exporter LysO family protein [Betaproteobacteria bacterium]
AAGPLIARYISPFAPIAAGGATSMDTCLPMIVASSGERYGIVAVFSGIVLTVLVPLLVPLFLLA